MKILLATEQPEEIRHGAEAGLIDAVVFADPITPLDGGASSEADRLSAIARDFALPVYVSVGAVASADIYRLARELRRLLDRDNVVVQIPLVEDAIVPIHKLSIDGIMTCATYVYTPAQALVAAKAGATSIMVGLQDLNGQGTSGVEALSGIRAALDYADAECDVFASSATTPASFVDCVMSGADGVCVSPEALRSFVIHPLTDRGVDRLLSQMSRHHHAPRS
jgi:transaldolase